MDDGEMYSTTEYVFV